jgi:signal transduction histidine kinase
MSKAQMARIFEPFFTTKPAGRGTGLGLSICRDIAEEHDGRLEVASEPGRGSRFSVRLRTLASGAPFAHRHDAREAAS